MTTPPEHDAYRTERNLLLEFALAIAPDPRGLLVQPPFERVLQVEEFIQLHFPPVRAGQWIPYIRAASARHLERGGPQEAPPVPHCDYVNILMGFEAINNTWPFTYDHLKSLFSWVFKWQDGVLDGRVVTITPWAPSSEVSSTFKHLKHSELSNSAIVTTPPPRRRQERGIFDDDSDSDAVVPRRRRRYFPDPDDDEDLAALTNTDSSAPRWTPSLSPLQSARREAWLVQLTYARPDARPARPAFMEKWVFDLINFTESTTILTYFVIWSRDLHTDNRGNQTERITRSFRCCNKFMVERRGSTSNLTTHLFGCPRRLEPLGSVPPWDRTRARRKTKKARGVDPSPRHSDASETPVTTDTSAAVAPASDALAAAAICQALLDRVSSLEAQVAQLSGARQAP